MNLQQIMGRARYSRSYKGVNLKLEYNRCYVYKETWRANTLVFKLNIYHDLTVNSVIPRDPVSPYDCKQMGVTLVYDAYHI